MCACDRAAAAASLAAQAADRAISLASRATASCCRPYLSFQRGPLLPEPFLGAAMFFLVPRLRLAQERHAGPKTQILLDCGLQSRRVPGSKFAAFQAFTLDIRQSIGRPFPSTRPWAYDGELGHSERPARHFSKCRPGALAATRTRPSRTASMPFVRRSILYPAAEG